MKETLIMLLFLTTFFSCVSEKKYQELEQKYYAALKDRGEWQSDKNILGKLEKSYETLAKEREDLEKMNNSLKKQLELLQKDHSDLKAEYDKLGGVNNKNTKLNRDLAENQNKVNSLQEELKNTQKLLTDKTNRIRELETSINKQKEALNNLKTSLQKALKNYEGKGITVIQKEGNIYVSMENKLLFDSGKWEVEKEGVKALKELSKILKYQQKINIVVEGHTDSDKYHPSGEVKDNWDLSVMRATAITKILQKEGVSPSQMLAAGKAEYDPVASNSTAIGKAKNRRVDIILAPDLGEINKLLNQL